MSTSGVSRNVSSASRLPSVLACTHTPSPLLSTCRAGFFGCVRVVGGGRPVEGARVVWGRVGCCVALAWVFPTPNTRTWRENNSLNPPKKQRARTAHAHTSKAKHGAAQAQAHTHTHPAHTPLLSSPLQRCLPCPPSPRRAAPPRCRPARRRRGSCRRRRSRAPARRS